MRHFLTTLLLLLPPLLAPAQLVEEMVLRFELEPTSLSLERPTQAVAFFDVLGRKAGVLGYENRPFEVWTYPLKLISDFRLAFEIKESQC